MKLFLTVVVILMRIVEIRAANDYIEYVTLNFYNNLQDRYNLKSHNENKNYEYISKEITNFHNIALRKPRSVEGYAENAPIHETNLRHLTNTDVYRFMKFEEITVLKSRFILDITVFSHKIVDSNAQCWYAATLEEEYQTEKSLLVLYKFISDSNGWKVITEEIVHKSSAIRSVSVADGTLLVISGKYKKLNYELFTGLTVFMLNDNNKISNIQTLKTELFSDFELWSDSLNIFLIVAIDHKKEQYQIQYEFNNPLYIWKGSHFDILQYLFTSNVRKITPFQIGASSYISVANYKNNYGETKIFSEIFKYNSQILEFTSIQKLPTNGATHVQCFNFHWGTLIETFIIVVNKFDSSNKKNEFYLNSIIYKYEGGLFIPFQNVLAKDVEKWLPIMGEKNEFILIGISSYGNGQIYQYNGWRFLSISVDFSIINSITGEKNIKSFVFYEKHILTVSTNTNGESITSFYEPLFQTINPIQDFKNVLSTWSNKVQQTLDCSNDKYFKSSGTSDRILQVLNKYHEVNNSTNHKILLNHAVIDKIETNSVYSEDFEFNHVAIQNINNILSSLNSQLASVKSLSEILSLTLLSNDNVLTKSLHIENIELTCITSPCYLNQITSSKLNKKDIVQFQNEVIYIQSGFSDYKEVEINNLLINYKFTVQNLNKKPIKNIKKLIQTLAENAGVVVKGTIFMDKGFSLSGELNNIKINDEVILCKDVNQKLRGHFLIPKINSAIVEVPQINDLKIDDFRNFINNENKTVSSIYDLSKITVEDVILKSVFNGIHFDALKENTLKLKGAQDFKGSCNIMQLTTNSVIIDDKKTKNMLMNNFIKINNESYDIKNGVFLSKFDASDLVVGKRLNNIPIAEGRLQVLLLNSPDNQKMTAEKLFENVELMGPVNLLGKINRGVLERKNPVSMIEEPLILKGDYVIRGNVSIEMAINCDNLIDSNNDQSLKQLQRRALKLLDTNVEIPLVFSQPLETKFINCDSVNAINPISWISIENENSVVVSGKKTYMNNLKIQGSCFIQNSVNKVNPLLLNENVLKVFGDQEVKGKTLFSNITTKSLSCNRVYFGKNLFDDILTSIWNYNIQSETIINKIAIVNKMIYSNKTEIIGNVGNWNLNAIISDTVYHDDRFVKIQGYMNVNSLIINNLCHITDISGINVNEIESKATWNKKIFFKRPLYFNLPINIENIYFTMSLTGVSKADFGYSWLLAEGDQILHGHSNFKRLSCLNAIDIELDKINNIDINIVSKYAIWINDDHQLGTIIYESDVIVKKTMNSYGFIDYIEKPEKLMLRTPNKKNKIQHITGTKNILNNVYVDGKILTYYIRNISLDYFCSLMKLTEDYISPSLILEGNLAMMSEPHVDKLWNSPVEEIIDNVWFKDMKFTTKKNMFFDNVIFKNEIVLLGLINNIDLNWMLNNFVHLKDEQNLSGSFSINNIYADIISVGQQTIVQGFVQNEKLENIYFNTLKTYSNQVLRESLKFDVVAVQGDIYLFGLLNYFNLTKDLMQLKAMPNIVDGYKYFQENDMKINYVFCKYIQNTDMAYYIDYSVQRNKTNILYLNDVKLLKYATFKNLNIEGMLNNKSTNYLYLNGELQTIFGKKNFQTNDYTYLHSIIAKNTINEFDIALMYQNLILKTSTDVVIFAPKIILNSIYTRNVLINDAFNDRKFDEIISGIEYTNTNNYIGKFESLIENSTSEIGEYLKQKSFKIHDFELDTILHAYVEAITMFKYVANSTYSYLVTATRTPDNFSVVSIYKWSIEDNNFVPHSNIAPLYFDESISKLFVISTTKRILLFVETVALENNRYKSIIFDFNPQGGFTKMQEMPSNITISVVIVQIEHQTCVIVAGLIGPAYLHCLVESQNYLRMYRPMSIFNSTQIEIIKINDVLHLVVNMPKNIEILYWEKSDHRKLAVLQSLPIATTFSVEMWNNNSYLATGYSKQILIYRFSKNLQRFIEIQTFKHFGNVRKIYFDVASQESLMLSVVVQETQNTDLLFIYMYDGLAGFRMSFVKNLRFPFIKDIVTSNKHGLFSMALALYDRISLIKFNSVY